MDMAARLGRTCRAARERADVTLIQVAVEAGVGETTIHNFEVGRGWRRRTDEIITAYARLCDTSEIALWQAAVEMDG